MSKIIDFFKKLNFFKTDSVPHPLTSPLYPGDLCVDNVKNIFSGCSDFKTSKIYAGNDKRLPVYIFFFDGLVDPSAVAKEIIEPLSNKKSFFGLTPESALKKAEEGGVYRLPFNKTFSLDSAAENILNGFCVVLFGASKTLLAFDIKSAAVRNVEKPSEEKIVKGAKDGFVESLNINLALVRRKIKNAELKSLNFIIGRQSNTKIAVVYLNGIANPNTLEKIKSRISNIDIDGVLSSESFEERIADFPFSSFPQFITTERCDKFSSNLLEGRIGIFVDGLPFGYLAPATFAQFFKTPEDNSNKFIIASAITLLRYFSFVITLLLPGFFVAVATFHHEMIPTKLMLSIISSKQFVPFSTAAEALGMLLAFELLQEAGLRLPNSVGQTVSIIGALIVGQSAVEAKVASPVIVIVIAIAGVSGYTIPDQAIAASLRAWRFILTVLALVFGMFGLSVGLSLFIYRLCCIESFGVAYMTPFSSSNMKSIVKALIRPPLSLSKKRDPALKTPNERNQF